MEIKVISFDIFQTLVDVNKRALHIWSDLLGESYSEENNLLGTQAILSTYPKSLKKALESNRFSTMHEVYYDCAESVIKQTGFSITPEELIHILFHHHSVAPVYDDVLHCMERLKGRYKIILSSDSSHTMVDDLVNYFIYDELFISDDLLSYKADPEGKFFRQVVRRLGVKPAEILHIGDSISDVMGASRAGVKSCWINREQSVWNYETAPDYTIESLTEIEAILAVQKVS